MTRAQYLLGVQTENENFVYDKLGNRTTLKHNGTDVARYQHNDVNAYTYIGLGSGTNVTHDDAGNMTGDHDGYTYHYDYENRLTRVKKSSDTLDVAVYTYDALGRRIAVEDCIADTTTHYYYDGWRVLSETDDNDDWSRDYDYGNYIDEVLVMTDASDDHYFAHDHLFSVVALTDEDGDILEQYEYDAYGKCHFYDSSFTLLGTQKSAHANTRLFTSQVLDILDGGALSLEYFKNRYKKDGRFITRDPLGVRDGICIIEFAPTGAPGFPRMHNVFDQYRSGVNLYMYVKSNPTANVDSHGLYLGFDPGPNGLDFTIVCCRRNESCGGYYHHQLWPKCCPSGWTQEGRSECDCYKAAKIIYTDASEDSGRDFPGRGKGHNDDRDAYRHCLASCRLARDQGQSCAHQAGTGHEILNINPPRERRSDLHNNNEGRKAAKDCSKSCDDACKEKLLDGDLDIVDESPRTTPPYPDYDD